MMRLNKESVHPFLRGLNDREKVLCPQWTGEKDLLLMPLGEGVFTGDIGRSALSPKDILFPQVEEILSFEEGGVLKIVATEKTLVFGIRPCEMRAIHFVDRFMKRDGLLDPNYLSKRDLMTTMVVACREPPGDRCFCIDAGAMPYMESGFDVQLFDTGDWYIAAAGSKRGEELLSNGHFEDGSAGDEETLKAIKGESARSQAVRPGFERAVERLKEVEPDPGFWEKLAERCINCGSCVYVCPTCTCYNVYDLPSMGGYLRRRGWDACLHAGFTRETSGHNPRPTQGARLARRHLHKLKFDVMNFGDSGCVGCGRCSDACPVGLGAIEIIEELNRSAYPR